MDKKNLIAFLVLSLGGAAAQQPAVPAAAAAEAQGWRKTCRGRDAGAKPATPRKWPPLLVAQHRRRKCSARTGTRRELLCTPDVPEVPLEFVSLGSLDRDTGYRMLVTLTNQGAAVRRAELSSPRFLDLTDRSGYLGHLEFENDADGVKCESSAQARPRATAGILKLATSSPVSNEPTTSRSRSKRSTNSKLSARKPTPARRSSSPSPAATIRRKQLTAKLVRRPLEVMRRKSTTFDAQGDVPDDFVDPPSFLVGMAAREREFSADAADNSPPGSRGPR